ncbi:MAG TPA: nucleoside recognition domain-containing protein [Lacipirellulaceae bacterium]|jgi:spore maturation protein A|nr:nucleoside recognition domain-containing protein [Lacipirellulaceae bacterium]
MLNKIWFWLLCIGIVYGFCKATYQTFAPPVPPAPADAGKSDEKLNESALTAMGKRLNGAVLEASDASIKICIPLIGIMALWLGLLNVAKDAGLIDVFARLVRPFMRWLFPEVPDGHPAQGAMLMNFSANMLGLDNAATPMGLKAMEELQTLNPVNDTATNSMALFLAINCGSITLIPFTIIGYRFASGSKDPAGIILGTLLASTASVVAGVTAARWLARSSKYQIATSDLTTTADPTDKDGAGS